jgi:hypothetical protein
MATEPDRAFVLINMKISGPIILGLASLLDSPGFAGPRAMDDSMSTSLIQIYHVRSQSSTIVELLETSQMTAFELPKTVPLWSNAGN